MSGPSDPRTQAAIDGEFTVRVGTKRAPFRVTSTVRLDRGVLVLYGPSGSGKSLTLKALAGLVRPERGHLRVGGRVLFDTDRGLFVKPQRRRIGYVPQHHSLFPFKDVAANVAFGLPRRERRRDHPTVARLLEELSLTHLARSPPASLSGGERQRVALARALAVEPTLLLLDEPFASIDRDGRVALRALVRETLARHGISGVFVTHSPEEALQVGDWMARFERGRTAEQGTPAQLLGADAPVVVRGAVRETGAPDADGRVRVTLERTVVTGPAELMEADDAGELSLTLQRSVASEE